MMMMMMMILSSPRDEFRFPTTILLSHPVKYVVFSAHRSSPKWEKWVKWRKMENKETIEKIRGKGKIVTKTHRFTPIPPSPWM